MMLVSSMEIRLFKLGMPQILLRNYMQIMMLKTGKFLVGIIILILILIMVVTRLLLEVVIVLF